MLERALEQYQLLAFFNSVEMRDLLIDKIIGDGILDEKIGKQIERIFRIKAGAQWRNNEYEAIAARHRENSFSIYWLDELFEKYYDFDGYRVVAKKEYLEEYNAICRDINPFYIIAYRMANMLRAGSLNAARAEDISENTTGIAVDFMHNKVYAENHCHLGGCFTCNRELLFLTGHSPKQLGKEFLEQLPNGLRDNFSLSPASELRILPQTLGFIIRAIIGFEQKIDSFSAIMQQIKGNHNFDFRIFKLDLLDIVKLRALKRNDSEFNLLQLAAKQFIRGHYDSAMLLLLCAIFISFEESSGKQKLISWLFLLQMNFLRSGIVMSDGSGLNEFVKYYDSKIKDIIKDETAITNILVSGTKKFELRQAQLPKASDLARGLKAIGKTIEKRHPECMHLVNGAWQTHCIPHPAQQAIQFNFGYHFIKSKKPAKVLRKKVDKKIELRNQDKYTEFHKKTNDLIKFINSRNNNISLNRLFRAELNGKNNHELSKYTFNIARLLRVIDAAGDENLVPPEVYAPFARKLRNIQKNIDMRNPADKKLRNLRFAFHAGEDFCHILTGIRHVYETIHFMNYQRHDRLGHALAIGIDPRTWLIKKCEIVIPMHELFDNYVWLWHMSLRIAEFSPQVSAWSDFYEEKAMKLVNNVYPDCDGCNIRDFYEAWTLRRNHPIFHQCKDYAPDFAGNQNHNNIVEEIYNYYLYQQESNDKANALVFLRYGDFFKSHDDNAVVRKSEVDFWHLIQDYLLKECEAKGIIIEANPSSNIYIGEFDRYHEHPIFRWSPICNDELKPGGKYNKFGLRSGPVEVCVNTDDQGIFSTTLQNEFNLLRNSANSQFSYNIDQIDSWLERLRQKGIDIFDENYISPYETER